MLKRGMSTSVLLLFIQTGLFFTAVTGVFRSVYVCEGKEETIRCDGGMSIISAIYGRSNNVTCHHSSMKSLNCRLNVSATDSILRCEGTEECSLLPSNTIYKPDPCSGTYKYLEVNFTCPSEDTITTTTTITTRETRTPPTNTELLTSSEMISETRTATTDVITAETKASCSCSCRYLNDTKCAEGDLLCRIAMLKQQLLVNKFALSLYKRTKISVYDGRMSSTLIGMSGVAVIATVSAFIIIPDFLTFLKFIKHRSCNKKRNCSPV